MSDRGRISGHNARRVALAVLALGACGVGVVLPSGAGGETAGLDRGAVRETIGHSVAGRPITAVRLGDPAAERVALVVGLIHGDERAGLRIARRLRLRYRGLRGAQIWVVDSFNPDGRRLRSRRNRRGVDLNRNFSHRWRGGVPRTSGYYPGPRPFSEPESRAARELILQIRPDVTVWYHQPWDAVLACRGRPKVAGRYARLARLRTSCRGGGLHGTAVSWQRRAVPGSSAFVVELAPGPIGSATARRHARAILGVSRLGAKAPLGAGAAATRKPKANPAGRAVSVPRGAESSARAAAVAAAPRPRIDNWLIPYPKSRKRDMARYSKRHYGKYRWRLRDPKLIIEHYAEAGSVSSIHATFAPNRPDPEFGALPGVCAHFAISASGQIFKLVPVSVRCRHVVGLNHVAIGIEHVGFSDADVLDRKRELRASLKLTRWLRCRFGLPVKRVIGHAESLGSPFYRELDPAFQGQTHGDLPSRAMRVYRRKLARLGGC